MKKLLIILAVGFIGCKKCQTCTTRIVHLGKNASDNTYVGDSCGHQGIPGDGKTVCPTGADGSFYYITKTCVSK